MYTVHIKSKITAKMMNSTTTKREKEKKKKRNVYYSACTDCT